MDHEVKEENLLLGLTEVAVMSGYGASAEWQFGAGIALEEGEEVEREESLFKFVPVETPEINDDLVHSP